MPLIAAINDRSFWPEILDDLNVRLPKEDIWITELVATSGGDTVRHARCSDDVPRGREPGSHRLAAASLDLGPLNLAIDGLLVRGLYLFNPETARSRRGLFSESLVDSPWFAIDPNN